MDVKEYFYCKILMQIIEQTTRCKIKTFEVLKRWTRTNEISSHTFSSIIQKMVI